VFDVTALFNYSLGCSLIQLSLWVAMFVIDWPDIQGAKKLDQQFKAQVLSKGNTYNWPHFEGIMEPREFVDEDFKLCENDAYGFWMFLVFMQWYHFFSIFVTFFREAYDANISTLA